MVFSGLFGGLPAEVERWAFRLDMELLCKDVPIPDGLGDAEGVRSFDGRCEGEAPRGVSGGTGRFFLVLEVGNGGRAVVGGFVAGRDGWGIVDVMLIDSLVLFSLKESDGLQCLPAYWKLDI